MVGIKDLASQLITRAKLASLVGFQFGTDRDIYAALGYKRNLTFDDFNARYVRQDIAGRIIDAFPQATWQRAPTVVEDDNPEQDTKFEAGWGDLVKRLKIFHYMERADRLAGIGRYSAILIGVAGGANLDTPMRKLRGPDDIIFLSTFSEEHAEIIKLVDDTSNSRFGMPEKYKLNLNTNVTQLSLKKRDVIVHHSRIIHVAEGLLEDELFGRPRLQRAYNLLDDLQKVVGGSAEMFWLAASRGMQADVDKDMTLDEDDEKALSDEIDEYVHGLRRWIRTRGIKINPLTGEITDPRGAFSVIMSLISGVTGIPQRVLMGAERGQLASQQDERNWNSRIKERQESFAEPIMLRPFIERLQSVGGLPEADYEIKWPDLTALTEESKSQVAARVATAIKAVSEQTNPVVTAEEFRKHWLGLPAEMTGEPIKETESTNDG